LPGEGPHAPLATIPRVRAARLVLVPRPAQTCPLVLQDVRSDQQTQFDGQTLQGVLHQGQQLVPIEGELHLLVGVLSLGSTLGQLSLVSDPSVRIGSFQGGSSSTKGQNARQVYLPDWRERLLPFQPWPGHPPCPTELTFVASATSRWLRSNPD